jgi:hypothetical protein
MRVYQIKIKGELDKSWAAWLGSEKMATDFAGDGSAVTTLVVDAADQPALFGILDRIRDLNLILLSVDRVEKEI